MMVMMPENGGSTSPFPIRQLLLSRRSAPAVSTTFCPSCNRGTLLLDSKYESVQRATANLDSFLSACFNTVSGLGLGSAIAFFLSNDTVVDLFGMLIRYHYRMLGEGMDWLENFPVGFKLNERLTDNLGREVRTLMNAHERVVLGMIASSVNIHLRYSTAVVLLLTGALFGCSGLVALIFDAFRLATAHLSIVSWGFRRVYQAELYLLSALWRVFRGKKRNILRHRTDTMEYDSMQLLVGTILFAVALFLFTTILVYHTFFATLNLVALCSSLLFALTYVFLRLLPFGGLALRYTCPASFVTGVYLVDESVVRLDGNSNDGLVDITRLVSVKTPYGSMLTAALAPAMRSILVWSTMTMLREFVTGAPSEKQLVATLLGLS
jgi:N-acetylglucosaminyl transferase component (Gpi1)